MLCFASAGALLTLLVASKHDLDTAVVALLAGSVEEVPAKLNYYFDLRKEDEKWWLTKERWCFEEYTTFRWCPPV